MTKVCHMTSAHSPEDVRIFHKECTSLAKAGYEVYVVEHGDTYEKNGVHMIGIGEETGGRLNRMLLASRRVYQKALELDADIYHLHDPELLPYGLKLKKRGKRVIFDSHEHTAESIYEKGWLPKFARNLVFHIYSRYQKFICSRLDAVISVTPNIVEYFQKINPNTVQIANYPIYKKTEEQNNEKKRRVVFAGGITGQWNHHILIKALEKLPDVQYCLCGHAPSAYMEQLQALPAWKQVDYRGRIPHAQVAEQLASSMVGIALLSPGRNTDWQNGTIGNTKIFEEMMAGLPVVCTDFKLWRAFVDRYHCGICVNPNDEESVANAIAYLINNPEEAKQMGRNGIRAVEAEFNWGVEEQKLLSLYATILN